MDQATHNKIVAVILGNTDDVLHDRKSRGSYSPLRMAAVAAWRKKKGGPT